MTRGHFTVWALVLALCAYGWTSVTVQVLGPDHRHMASPAARAIPSADPITRVADTFQEIRDWRSSLYQRLGLREGPHQHADGSWHTGDRAKQPMQASNATAPSVAPGHVHLSFQRHHHAMGDPTVVAIDAGAIDLDANGGASASVLGAALMPPVFLQLFSFVRSVADARWPLLSSARWSDAMVSPLDRPPSS